MVIIVSWRKLSPWYRTRSSAGTGGEEWMPLLWIMKRNSVRRESGTQGIQDAYMDLGLAGSCVALCGGKIHDKCLWLYYIPHDHSEVRAGWPVPVCACVPMSTFSAPVRAAWVSWPHSPHHDPLMVSNNVIRDNGHNNDDLLWWILVSTILQCCGQSRTNRS